MSSIPEQSDELRGGRRDLDSIPGFEALDDLYWDQVEGFWVLHFRIRLHPKEEGGTHLDVTEWFALVANEYPVGPIRIAPSACGGLTNTYPHQKANRPARSGRLWRTGDLCVATPRAAVLRESYNTEPYDAPSRLAWHITRTRAWLEAARAGRLLADGDPFELPVFGDIDSTPIVVFEAAATSIATWRATGPRSGFVRLQQPGCNQALRIVRGFRDDHDNAMPALSASWGAAFDDGHEASREFVGAWFLLESLPVAEPWQAPTTWGELCLLLVKRGMNLREAFKKLAPRLRHKQPFIVLLGAPIPETMGAGDKLVHWLALQGPALASKPAAGWRTGEEGFWQRDLREGLAEAAPLHWINTANWAPAELGTRGGARESLRESTVAVLGAGALGSSVCEILVREGVTSVLVVDGDALRAGNLTRHTLTVGDLARNKATALAERLNLLSPHSRAKGLAEAFPAREAAELDIDNAQVVIDCTASNELLEQLARCRWQGPKVYISCALGVTGRFYVFICYGPTFPKVEFVELMNPWLRLELDEYPDPLPWEGTGCWHPVFPARASDIWLFAAAIPRLIEQAIQSRPATPALVVFERVEDASGVIALRRVKC